MPRASIVITTHNRPHTLPRAIASAFAAGADVEVIVVDDASSDETSRICESTPEIKYVRLDRNQGVAGARNVGLVATRGEFVSFLDDDDVRLPHSLDEQIAVLQRSPEAMFCYAQAIPEDQSGEQAPPFPAICETSFPVAVLFSGARASLAWDSWITASPASMIGTFGFASPSYFRL